MRKRLYETIFCHKRNGWIAAIYDGIMIIAVLFSLSTLIFYNNPYYPWIDKISAGLFVIDYLLRFLTADFKYKKLSPIKAFLTYPFHPMSILDALSILPSFIALNKSLKLLKFFKLLKLLRVMRLAELVHEEFELFVELEHEHELHKLEHELHEKEKVNK